DSWSRLEARARDLVELGALADGDSELAGQVAADLAVVDREVEQRELELLFRDPYSDHNAILSISAGAGGVDAQDWVEMLLRMYLKWAERRRFKTEVLEATPGEEAGLKGASLLIAGPRAYGLLRSEHGVHRLVRISPFDQNHRRHTSFALVEVMPELEETDAEIKIDPEDLRIDTYRSTGAGAQPATNTEW